VKSEVNAQPSTKRDPFTPCKIGYPDNQEKTSLGFFMLGFFIIGLLRRGSLAAVRVLFVLILCVAGMAWSQQCFDELVSNYSPEDLQRPASNEDAISLVVSAVQLLEPVLPALHSGPLALPAQTGSQHDAELRYLAERKLLPSTMKLGAFNHDDWLEMLWRIASWYDLKVFSGLSSSPSLFELIRDVAALLDKTRNLRDPIAIINTEAGEPSQVVFLALIHLDSIYPRLIVSRPDSLPFRDRQAYLERISTCTMHIQHYFTSPGPIAARLFSSNNESRIIIAYSKPELYPANTWVPQGQEIEALTFASEQTRDLQQYAAIFWGSGLSPQLLPRILLQVRTNMSLGEIRALF
jgi:hypothetical protein